MEALVPLSEINRLYTEYNAGWEEDPDGKLDEMFSSLLEELNNLIKRYGGNIPCNVKAVAEEVR